MIQANPKRIQKSPKLTTKINMIGFLPLLTTAVDLDLTGAFHWESNC